MTIHPIIPRDEYTSRWARVQRMMKEYALDLVIAYADDRAVFGPAHARWLANFLVHFEPVCVLWDLFEDQEETLCRSYLTGVIETNDGAPIRFDSLGFFMRPDDSNPHKWITSAAVHFDTTDPRYAWLNTLLAIWEGELDMKTYSHLYQAYAHTVESFNAV